MRSFGPVAGDTPSSEGNIFVQRTSCTRYGHCITPERFDGAPPRSRQTWCSRCSPSALDGGGGDEAGGQGRFAGGKSDCGRRLVLTVCVGGDDGGSGGGVGEVGGVEVVFSSTSVVGVDDECSSSVESVGNGSSSTSGRSLSQITRSVRGVLAGITLTVVGTVRSSSSVAVSLVPTELGDGVSLVPTVLGDSG